MAAFIVLDYQNSTGQFTINADISNRCRLSLILPETTSRANGHVNVRTVKLYHGQCRLALAARTVNQT